MSGPLRVLLTNLTLGTRTGTELYVRDAALGLLRRGHAPMVYTPEAGPVAAEIRAAGVPVVTDLARLGARPDVIHGHHHQQTLAALLCFPGVPGIFIAHDWAAWHDAPPAFPRLLRYVAVDDTLRDRLVVESGLPAERVEVLLNGVDLDRFQPRPPLPARPRRALVFSNYAREETHLPAVREACRRAGLDLDVLGAGMGRPVAAPEAVLGEYDLVFAKARSALEALAVGAAVVLCDSRGLGPLVTAAELDGLRRLNLGLRTLTRPLHPGLMLGEIERYDPADAAAVSRRVRETAGLDLLLDGLLGLYRQVIAEAAQRGPASAAGLEAELRAAGAYLQAWSGWQPHLRSLVDDLDGQRQRLDLRVRELEHDLDGQRQRLDLRMRELELEVETARLRGSEARELAARHDALWTELQYLRGTSTWRLRTALLRLPGLPPAWRALKALAGRRLDPPGPPAPADPP